MILACEGDLKEKCKLLKTKIWHSVSCCEAAGDWQVGQRGRPQAGQSWRWGSLARQETQTRAGDSLGPETRAGSASTTSPASSSLLVLILLPAASPLTPTTSNTSILLRYWYSPYEGMCWLNWTAHVMKASNAMPCVLYRLRYAGLQCPGEFSAWLSPSLASLSHSVCWLNLICPPRHQRDNTMKYYFYHQANVVVQRLATDVVAFLFLFLECFYFFYFQRCNQLGVLYLLYKFPANWLPVFISDFYLLKIFSLGCKM